MIIDSKVRKMARFGDEKKSLIVNIFYITPFSYYFHVPYPDLLL